MDLKSFVLKSECFDHHAYLHGSTHTYRVMALVRRLAFSGGMKEYANAAFCAAFIHDMARKHDGVCHAHGPEAAERKLPLFRGFFMEQGLSDEELQAVYSAVYYHSLTDEIESSHPHYIVTALLKDADALDRIRLGSNNLKADMLRFDFSREMIRPARKLFLHMMHRKANGPLPFIECLDKYMPEDYDTEM